MPLVSQGFACRFVLPMRQIKRDYEVEIEFYTEIDSVDTHKLHDLKERVLS